jgi:hypothetical protein
MSFRDELLKSAESLELMARESQAQSLDPDNSKSWREHDAANARRLFDTAEFYRQWAARETQ